MTISKILNAALEPKYTQIISIAKVFDLPECFFFEHDSSCCGNIINTKQMFITPVSVIDICYDSMAYRTFSFVCYMHDDLKLDNYNQFYSCQENVDLVFTVIKGRIDITLGEKSKTLQPGDTLHISNLERTSLVMHKQIYKGTVYKVTSYWRLCAH